MMHQGLPIPPTKNDADWKTACGLALKAVEKAGKTMAGVQVGKTMVLYKAVQVRHAAHRPSTVRTDHQLTHSFVSTLVRAAQGDGVDQERGAGEGHSHRATLHQGLARPRLR
jgi:hypothetical protein